MSDDFVTSPDDFLSMLLDRARTLSAARDFEAAESVYAAAKTLSATEFGKESGHYGLVLLEIADFFELCDQPEKLHSIRDEVRLVLKGHLEKNSGSQES
jgi:hypothetical protein